MPSPASPGTNQYRCSACGRYLNTIEELREHELECVPAKVATHAGEESLKEDRRTPHAPNDQGR